MTAFTVLAVLLAVAAVAYLVVALILPEKLGPHGPRLRAARQRRVERTRG